MKALVLAALLGLAPCAASRDQIAEAGFWDNLAQLCSSKMVHPGRLIADEGGDGAFIGKQLAIGPASCSDREIRIPVRVGDDTSRTWIVRRANDGKLTLKHRHIHADGTEDALTSYGGLARDGGSATRQSFGVDAESAALFRAQERLASLENVWTVEVTPGATLTYELRRSGRHARLAFDLTRGTY